MNKKIKEAFNNIKLDDKFDDKVFNMTINKTNNKQKTWKLSYTFMTIFLIGILSIGVVYAKEIRDFINSFSSNINVENNKSIKLSDNINFKDISNNALKIEKDNPELMNFNEVENNLGFKILKLKDNNTNEIYYSTELNDNTYIGRVDLWIPYYVKESADKYISVNVSMLNKGADEKYILAFEEGLDASGGKNNFEEYYSSTLNTKIILYSYSINDINNQYLRATFIYDDVLYIFTSKNIVNNDLINYIDSLVL